MARTSLRALAILMATVCALAQAQTVDEILSKHYAALGGLDNLKALTSMKTSGKMVMGGGMEAPFTSVNVRPTSVRFEVTFQGKAAVSAFDGKTAWTVNPFMGSSDPEVMPKEEADDFIEDADFDGPLVDYKDKGSTIEFAGKEDVEGTDALKLKLTLKNGKIRFFYLDADSYLILKTTQKVSRGGQEIEVASYPGNYKKVGNVIQPYSVEQKANGKTASQMTFDTIELNQPVDNSIFAMPAKTEKK
jgi:outer membrane lipoprotein-sorting protein